MSSLSLSQMLRPYAAGPMPAKAAVYARFYAITRRRCVREYSTQPSDARSDGAASSNKPRASEPSEAKEAKEAEKVAKKQREEQARATEKRVQKLRDLNALQWPRIQSRTSATPMCVPEFRSKHRDLAPRASGTEEVQLRGRVLASRKQSGKLAFLDIQGDFHTVQVMLDFSHISAATGITMEQFREKRLTLLRGDFVSVEGTANVTSQGELTLKVNKLPELLSPSIAPVPTKLVDEETMVQNRHLSLLVNRQVSKSLRFRSELIWWLRNYFAKRRFLEVQTPILADYAGGAAARPFLTSATAFSHKDLALRIAPELWLKRMVVGGFDRIFEIGPSFRNEGLDATHNPEFTMCEFYQAYADLPSLISLTTDLVQSLASWSREVLEKMKSISTETLDPAYFSRFEQVEFIPALEEVLKIKLPDLTDENALSSLQDVLRTELGLEVDGGMSLNKLLDDLASKYLEPKSQDSPLYITHHPSCMSPLSKSFTCPTTGQLVSARAELFVKGREIANMYEEENSPFEQRRKFELQVQARNANDPEEGEAVVDEAYIQALEHGLPPTGGWGCGIDRLVMLFSGATRISDTLSFGSLRNVVAASQVSKRA
ncbi:Adenylate kinase 2 [Pestalotiopsis sp. IQ-011]